MISTLQGTTVGGHPKRDTGLLPRGAVDHSANKKVLILSYQFPPDGGSIQRVKKYVQYLPEFGWDPVVVTHELEGVPGTEPAYAAGISRDVEILRRGKPGNQLSGVAEWLRKIVHRAENNGAESTKTGRPDEANTAGVKISPLRKFLRAARATFFWPDDCGWWVLPAVIAGRKRIKQGDISAIYTVTLPHSTSLAGYLLKKMTGLPWVQDFRDPWTDNSEMLVPTALHRAAHGWAESAVIRSADRVITTTENHASFVRFRLGKAADETDEKVVVITNGYDPEDLPSPMPEVTKKFVITYAGGFYGTRTPLPFFKALRAMRIRYPELNGRVFVRLIGNENPIVAAEIRQMELEDLVEWAGYMPHRKAIEEMASSSVLLVVVHNEPVLASFTIPAKVFEYMACRRPILAISPDGAAARLVRETKAGVVHEHEDVDGIMHSIADFYSKYQQNCLTSEVSTQDLERFERRTLTQKLASLLNATELNKNSAEV